MILFLYKLIGLDSAYTNLTNLNQIEYSNLTPNKYKLRVSAFYEGYNDEDYFEYEFEILPAFYQTKWFLIIVIVTSLTIIMLIFKIRTKNIKTRNLILEKIVANKTETLNIKLEEITKLYVEIKSKNNLIKESFEYAKDIQSIILNLNSNSKNSISLSDDVIIKELLYSPKEIIGGDFYSIININDVTIIIAADCTGHGVPGALLTILCQIFLNQIIIQQNNTNPSDILYALNNLLVKTFSIQFTDINISDGLAISILAINHSKNEVIMSESKQPFFIKYKDGNVKLIKSNSSSLNYDVTKAKYFNIVESIKTCSEFILFSDGLVDQAGIASPRLGTYGLKKWIETKDIKENYSDLFHKWKSNNSQRDDVLLIHVSVN